MTHLGTFEAGSDFSLIATLQDEDGVAIDLTGGTVTGYVTNRGAIYLNALPVSLTTPASGIVTWPFADTDSNKLPAGELDVIWNSVLAGTAVRIHRDTFTIVRSPHV